MVFQKEAQVVIVRALQTGTRVHVCLAWLKRCLSGVTGAGMSMRTTGCALHVARQYLFWAVCHGMHSRCAGVAQIEVLW